MSLHSSAPTCLPGRPMSWAPVNTSQAVNDGHGTHAPSCPTKLLACKTHSSDYPLESLSYSVTSLSAGSDICGCSSVQGLIALCPTLHWSPPGSSTTQDLPILCKRVTLIHPKTSSLSNTSESSSLRLATAGLDAQTTYRSL